MKKLIEHIETLPENYRGVLFCMSRGLRSYDGASFCGITPFRYNRLKRLLVDYLCAYRSYLENKEVIDRCMRRCLTMYQYKVFMNLLMNPFKTSKQIAKELGVNPEGSSVRNLLHRIRRNFYKSGYKELCEFDKLFKKVLFGRFYSRG